MTRSSAKRVADARPFTLGHHELTLAQDLQVPRDGRLRHVQGFGQLVDVHGPLVQGVQHEDALGVGETLADAGVQEIDFLLQGFVHGCDPASPVTELDSMIVAGRLWRAN